MRPSPTKWGSCNNPSLTAFIPRGRLHLENGESLCQKTVRILSLRAEPMLPTARVLYL